MRNSFIIITGIIIACLLAVSMGTLHAEPPLQQLFIVNTLSEDISVIDMNSDELLATIPLGSRGYTIALSPDGNDAYVTAVGSMRADNMKAQPQVVKVDVNTRAVAARFPLHISPLARVNIRPDGQEAYIVTAGDTGQRNLARGQVLFINLADGHIKKTVPVGLNPLDSVMSPDGSKLYTADWASHAISLVNLPEARLADTIPLGVSGARTLAMGADGKMLYTIPEAPAQFSGNMPITTNAAASYNNATNSLLAPQAMAPDDNALWEIDTTDGNIRKYPFAGISPIYALALSPDNAFLYAYGRDETTPAPAPVQQLPAQQQRQQREQQHQQQQTEVTYNLYVFDLKQNKVVRHLGNFGYLSAMVVSADGKKLYLIGTPGDPQTEASLQSLYQSKLATTRNSPTQSANSGLAVDDLMMDLRKVQKTVTVLDAQTGKILKTITIGNLPQGVAVKQEAK